MKSFDWCKEMQNCPLLLLDANNNKMTERIRE
jgi:hypothetical protein